MKGYNNMANRQTRKGYKQLNIEVPSYIKDKVLPEICAIDKRSQANMIVWLIEKYYQEVKK